MIYVIMGVLGSKKTTVGKMFAKKLGLIFHDADEYLNHKEKNLSKGIHLNDASGTNS